MKSIITLTLIFSMNIIFSQNVGTGADSRSGFESVIMAATTLNTLGGVGTFINYNKTEIVGSTYVFTNWKNIGVIDIDNKKYRLANINFNIKTNNFESQVGKDSVFILDIANVNHVYINNKKFKSFYFSKKKRDKSFEIIYDGDDFKLLKGYEVGIKYGETDPLMVKKKVDTYFITKTYYIRTGTDIQEIKLKKKKILSLFKDKAEQINKFAKENKLSFKKEIDLKKIFSYYNSL